MQIYASGEDDPITPDEIDEGQQATFEPPEGETVVDQPGLPQTPGAQNRKIYVDGVGVPIVAERVAYLDENGERVTEWLRTLLLDVKA